VVWTALRHAHAAVEDALEAVLGQIGLDMAAYEVLYRLAHHDGGAMRMHALADHALLTPSGLTRLIERLERAGYVSRRHCPSDRRGTEAVITPAGHEALAKAEPAIERAVTEQFGAELTDTESAALLRAFRKLLARHGRDSALGACEG